MKTKIRENVSVWIDADFLPEMMRVGSLSNDRGQYFFEYDADWLLSEHRFSIDPELVLFAKEQPAPQGAFKIFMDSAPDRWGRLLMNKRELVRAQEEANPIKPLREWDYLLGVQDATRMGALRLRDNQGSFIEVSKLPTPPITSLRELQAISREIEESDSASIPQLKIWLASLLAPGTSLGGARPKANFLDENGDLWIAKFPYMNDLVDVGLWELILHDLAKASGIDVPAAHAEIIQGQHHTFSVKRFDRQAGKRKMFVSAMTLLSKNDGEDASYLEIADFIRNQGDSVKDDLAQLWRRMVFNVMTSNRDDHLRNHGFIRNSNGWRLSPAYDMNPNPDKYGHALNLDFDNKKPSLDILFSNIEWFDLDHSDAVLIAKEVITAVGRWKEYAKKRQMSNNAILSMSPAFDLLESKMPEAHVKKTSKPVRY